MTMTTSLRARFYQIADEQGWLEDAMIDVLLQFIEGRSSVMHEAFMEFIENIAAFENESNADEL